MTNFSYYIKQILLLENSGHIPENICLQESMSIGLNGFRKVRHNKQMHYLNQNSSLYTYLNFLIIINNREL